jgi:hypothetical protein
MVTVRATESFSEEVKEVAQFPQKRVPSGFSK